MRDSDDLFGIPHQIALVFERSLAQQRSQFGGERRSGLLALHDPDEARVKLGFLNVIEADIVLDRVSESAQ